MAYTAAGQVAGKVGEYTFGKVGEQFGYFKHYKTNVNYLKVQVENLRNKKDRVQRQIDAARNNLENIETYVQDWVRRADETTSDTDTFLETDQEKANHRCFNGWCINLWARYKFGKEAFEKASEITKLQQEANFETVSYCLPLPEIVSFSSSNKFAAFESRKSKVKEIMEALDDENINVIGICGMGGVGKTTLVDEVCRQVKAEKKFDKIAMVVVSQTPNLTKIQEKIASELELKLENRDESERRRALWARIKNENKILVVLDDVWGKLELIDKVGIPFGVDHVGCKILLTSRSNDVCNKMGAQKILPIRVLDEQEAWKLFRGLAGEIVDSDDLNPIAREVARECGGLPIAIVTVGRALMNNPSKHVWDDAARQLKKSVTTNIEGMHAYVYTSLKLSYNYLGSEAKSCFLLCSLFPEDAYIPMDALVRYGMGLRLFQDVDTIEDVRHRALALVSTLVSSFLMLEVRGNIKMHDVVRDFAIHIASKEENKHIVKAGIGLTEWPNNDATFQNYTGISLMENNICALPDGLEFPKLETLLLQRNSPSYEFQIPTNFFRGIKDLKVLDMSGSQISSLPPSFLLLTALRTLCLEICEFIDDISIIGTLKQLEILSLSGSNIKEVPKHFAQLTHLKLFDLRFCSYLTQISPGVISSLHKLEELYIGRAFTHWEVEEEENSRSNASLIELISLSQLNSLYLSVPNADMFPLDLRFQKLTRFDITIGMTSDYYDESFEKELRLKYETRVSGPIEVLLKRTESLLLRDCRGLKNVLEDLEDTGFDKLKSLKIYRCNEMKYLLDMVDGASSVAPFRNLEQLNIDDMDNFSEICHGQLPTESFSKLKEIEVDRCPSMSENIVPSNLLSKLQHLETLRVGNCCSLLNVFDLKGLATKGRVTELLSRLETLDLMNLPELVKLWKGPHCFVNLRNLRSVQVLLCPQLRGQLFPPSLVQGLVRLETLELSYCNKLEEIFAMQEKEQIGNSLSTSTNLQNLTSVSVYHCNRLRNIFPHTIAKGLLQLKKLDIRDCAMVEAVVEDKEGEATLLSIDKIVFPCLYEIRLQNLDSLTCFFTGRYAVEFPSLEQMLLCNCLKMETFGHGVIMRPKLKKVHVQVDEFCQTIEDEGIFFFFDQKR